LRGRHRTARIGPAAQAYLRRVGRRGSALGVVAIVALVPVVASAAMVVPTIAATAASEGAAAVSGVAAALAGQVVEADPTADAAGSEPSEGTTEATVDAAGLCPPGPVDAQALAPAVLCAVSEPPAGDAFVATATAAAAASGVVPVSAGGLVFDPGNIASDAVFYDATSMTDEQIGAFLEAQGARCAGEWCLKNLRVDMLAQPADEFCAALPGGTGLPAAAVIGAVSRACGLNPQVMLVTLQKESGLLDRSAVSASNYDAAWGWHCPDTGPGGSANCDPAYAGFVNQASGMAKQWSRYRVQPERYNYRAGQTANIMWNVSESGCGGAPVAIANTATASLYNYTPYQPNAAALAAYPGVGDACSAYGNRNFFFLFNRYFGSTGGGRAGTGGTTAAGGLAVPVEVQVPANGFVAGGLAGRSITAPSAEVAAGLTAGFAALGLPYVWGGGGSGAGPNNGCVRGGGQYNSCGTEVGFDCSGLTAYVLGRAGFAVPGDSSGQRRSGIPVAWDRALPGDIVGYPGHVAVYLGVTDGIRYILEASWVGTPVHIVPLTRSDADPVVYRYWSGPGTAVGAASASGFVATGSAPRTFVPNLPPLPTVADVPRTAGSSGLAPSFASSSPLPVSSAPVPNPPSSGGPSSTVPSPTGPAASTVDTTRSNVAGTAPTGTTTTGTTSPSATASGSTATKGSGSSAATTTPTQSTTPKTTPTSAVGSPSATSGTTTTGLSTATSSQSATTSGPATSAASTATSSVTVAPPTTPVTCPTPTPEVTPVPTPTVPAPTVSTAAAVGSPAAALTTSFASLLESLTADPCA